MNQNKKYTDEKIKEQYLALHNYIIPKLGLFGCEMLGYYQFVSAIQREKPLETGLSVALILLAKGVSNLIEKHYYIPQLRDRFNKINKRLDSLEEKLDQNEINI